jgi:hypothetical protein
MSNPAHFRGLFYGKNATTMIAGKDMKIKKFDSPISSDLNESN